jgi:hypothetical protein
MGRRLRPRSAPALPGRDPGRPSPNNAWIRSGGEDSPQVVPTGGAEPSSCLRRTGTQGTPVSPTPPTPPRPTLRTPLPTRTPLQDFLARINRDADNEETGGRPPSGSERWLVGNNQRNVGSLHHDIWDGTGAELADRANLPLRYSLIISLRTPNPYIDLYTPIATQLTPPIAVEIDEHSRPRLVLVARRTDIWLYRYRPLVQCGGYCRR